MVARQPPSLLRPASAEKAEKVGHFAMIFPRLSDDQASGQ
jgi:hypothetical protein